MNSLVIQKYPNSILRKKCVCVSEITEKEKDLFEKMLFTMRYFCGIGLAAPQIGIAKKMIVAEADSRIIKLANPQIVGIRGSDSMAEGCLSVPDIAVDIKRATDIIVRGLDEKGKIVEIKANGLLARVLQHEIEHLKGKLIIDYRRTKWSR
jgi:peptide deformylase